MLRAGVLPKTDQLVQDPNREGKTQHLYLQLCEIHLYL